jgi:hypothetical protein
MAPALVHRSARHASAASAPGLSRFRMAAVGHGLTSCGGRAPRSLKGLVPLAGCSGRNLNTMASASRLGFSFALAVPRKGNGRPQSEAKAARSVPSPTHPRAKLPTALAGGQLHRGRLAAKPTPRRSGVRQIRRYRDLLRRPLRRARRPASRSAPAELYADGGGSPSSQAEGECPV